MAEAVHIPAPVLEGIVAHARETLPDECCGLLIGRADRVTRAVRAGNLTPTPTAYQIDPADHFAAIRSARADGLAVIGAYHSHPNAPAAPSRRDLAEAHFPEFVYLIVSIDTSGALREARAYRLTTTRATSLELAVD